MLTREQLLNHEAMLYDLLNANAEVLEAMHKVVAQYCQQQGIDCTNFVYGSFVELSDEAECFEGPAQRAREFHRC